jgi:hypothetical protein
MKRRRVALVCAAAVLLVLAGIAAVFGAFRSSSVCTMCGLVRQTFEWQVPFTQVTVASRSTESETPVSAVLLGAGIVPAHEHRWLFLSGSGNGVMCVIGSGRHIVPAVRSQEVAAVLAASQQYGVVECRDRLLEALFDLRATRAASDLCASAPPGGFKDASEFRAWLEKEKDAFDRMVEVYRAR